MVETRTDGARGSDDVPGRGDGPGGEDGSLAAPQAVEDADGTVRVALAAEHHAVTQARRYVARRWPEMTEDVLDDVSIIVSELVSNAVVHGLPEIEMRLRVVPFAVDVAVLDHNPALPSPPSAAPDPTSSSGRGLLLVDRLARRWGVEPFADGTGKTVWAHVETS